MKLTKRVIEGLEPKADSYLIWDAEVKGFGVRVYPTGKRTYVIQYRAGKRTRRLTLGQHGPLTTDEARKLAKQRLGDVARGEDPSADRQTQRRAPTVAALCDRFLDEYVAQHCKPNTLRSYRTIIKNHIRPKLGAFLINDVKRADVANLHFDMRNTPYHANRTLMVISKMFNVAEDWGLREEGANPTRRIKKYREEEKKRYLSDQEQYRLGQVLQDVLAEGSETIHVVSAYLLLMLTGCRRNEIQTLKWDYVHYNHLDLPDSKTGRRRIPLPREAYDILMSLPRREGNPYAILGTTDEGHITDLERPWRRIRERAGLPDVRIHDLRHTYASVAMKDGIDPFTLKEILGHKNLTTTLRYAHLADDAVQRAAGSVASRLAGTLQQTSNDHPNLRIVGV
ncbi:integrase arm-type DNA-binding domain-containing protein [Aliiroseovarius sp. KMU-50]|uniref:Integrase arm-type DNA-binding domain-containing protein n=1 Tax=Aliiroseovarius salicola TaxID=3009082 RepID=A0ABT4VY30_9RHOB|nr:site-specific integrase [Aliiroseovarius sp. KMU-50]MDA5092477.1 integrase arm-type DNA-binding domain-containing protein [Aliiroseovarius sp. KMU-50]